VTPPENIPVRYSEEEAGYVSFRPVVRQTFSFHELLDMILSVTGKDIARVRQILRAGTVAFRSYRYWWTGFEPEDADLRAALAVFPDADPGRAFSANVCTLVILESGGVAAREIAEIDREAASARRWLQRGTVWQFLLEAASRLTPDYEGYSYARRADVYGRGLEPPEAAALAAQAERLAPRALRQSVRMLADARRLLLVCPRQNANDSKTT
ncbi:MAG: hypothetical protein WBF35_00130, partial [Candidatus Acidiferrales bacterium]